MSRSSRNDRIQRNRSAGMSGGDRGVGGSAARQRRAAASDQQAGARYQNALSIKKDGRLDIDTDGTLRVDMRNQLGVRNKWPTPTEGTEAANKDYVDALVAALEDSIGAWIIPPDAHAVVRKLSTQAVTASYVRLVHNTHSNDLKYDPNGLITYPTFGPAAVVNKTCVEVGYAYALTHTVNLSPTSGFSYAGGTVRIGWQYLHNDGATVEVTEKPLSRAFVQYGTFASSDEGSVVVTSHAIIKPLGALDGDGDPVYPIAPVFVEISAASPGRFTVNNSHLHIRKLDAQQTLGTASPPPALPTSPPEAAFHADPVSGALGRGFSTTFYDDSAGIGITSYAWTFGDGGTSTAQNPGHTYTAAGSYTVTLTVTNAAGSDIETKAAYITVT